MNPRREEEWNEGDQTDYVEEPHTRPYSLLINESCVTRKWPKTELFIFISQTYPSVEQFGPIRLLLLFNT